MKCKICFITLDLLRNPDHVAERHTSDEMIKMLISAESKVLVKQKFGYVADVRGGKLALYYDERILTKLYADGQKIILKLIDDESKVITGNSLGTSLTVNGIVLDIPGDSEPEEMWGWLTALPRDSFDRYLRERLEYPTRIRALSA